MAGVQITLLFGYIHRLLPKLGGWLEVFEISLFWNRRMTNHYGFVWEKDQRLGFAFKVVFSGHLKAINRRQGFQCVFQPKNMFPGSISTSDIVLMIQKSGLTS